MCLVRSRLGGIVSVQENRHATAGCLLSVLLFLPFVARFYNPFLTLAFGLLYAGLIVPLMLSYITFSSCIHFARYVAIAVNNLAWQAAASLFLSSVSLLNGILKLHDAYLHLGNVNAMTSQVVIFMLVEKAVCPDQRFSSLYALLFFNILVYLKKSLTERPWSQHLQLRDAGDFQRATTAFVVIKLSKAVVLTMVLMMLTVQMKHYEPNFTYLLITGVYFINDTLVFQRYVAALLTTLKFDYFEGMEEFWSPVVTKVLSCVYAGFFIVLTCPHYHTLSLVACYTNVYVGYANLFFGVIPKLLADRAVLDKYPLVTKWHLERRNIDTTCSVCLDPMTYARLTRCNHAYHGQCLRRWLLENKVCPLCKQGI